MELLGSLDVDRRRAVLAQRELQESWRTLVFRPLFDSKLGITANASERLARVMQRCAQLELVHAGAYAASGRLVVYGEYEKNLAKVRREGAMAMKMFAAYPVAIAILEATIGQQLVLNGKPHEGVPLLARALEVPDALEGLERVNRLVDALNGAAELSVGSECFAVELEALLDSGLLSSAEMRCQVHAQLGIVRWRQGNRTVAFHHLRRAVEEELLLDDSVRSRHLAAGLAHTLTYFTAVVEKGVPPPEAADGNEFAEPHPRFFSGTNSAMAGKWKVRHGPSMLRWLVAQLGHAVGEGKASEEWMDAAWKGALEIRIPVLLTMLAPHSIVSGFATSDWRGGVDAATVSGRAFVYLEDAERRGEGILDDLSSFDPAERPSGVEARRKAEAKSLWLLSRGIVYVLGPMGRDAHGVFRRAAATLANVITDLAACFELKESWTGLADVLRVSAADIVTDAERSEWLRSSDASAARESIQFVAHGLLALREDCRLEQAAASQVGAVQEAQRNAHLFQLSTESYFVAIAAFWAEAIERSAFRFSAPSEVRAAIATASHLTPLERVRAILRAVTAGLGLQFDDATMRWLSQGVTSSSHGAKTGK